jgi:hypothetical protein
MGRQPLRRRERRRAVDQRVQSGFKVPARDSDAMRREGICVAEVPQRQAVAQHLLDIRGAGTARMILSQRPAAADQMIKTRLIEGPGVRAIRRPAVPDHNAAEVGRQSRQEGVRCGRIR